MYQLELNLSLIPHNIGRNDICTNFFVPQYINYNLNFLGFGTKVGIKVGRVNKGIERAATSLSATM